jgi:RES domain-containing protein
VRVAAYRIVKARRAAAAFDGDSARRLGGRWNRVGTRMVYTAASRSLAALEILVHLEGPARGFSLVRCEFPESLVEVLATSALPRNWRASPAPSALAALGDAWIRRGSSTVLAVPSAVIPEERNYLLNPAHADFAQVTIHAPEPFPYDARLIALTESRSG